MTSLLQNRRIAAAAAGALLLAPALSACGFNYATDRVNTISAGTNDRAGQVDVLGAVVIANSPGTGVFVASLSNNSQAQADTFNSLAGDGLTVAEQPDISVGPGGDVNLIADGGIGVTGSLVPGAFVKVQVGFSSGQTTTMTVNVVRPCFQYSPDKLGDLAFPAADPSGAASLPGTVYDENATKAGLPSLYTCDKVESTIRPDGHAPEEHSEEEPAEAPAE